MVSAVCPEGEALGRSSLGSRRARQNGRIDADLGGGVIKQWIARVGEGKSGGYRTIILFRRGERAIFMYGFAKSERENLRPDEQKQFKEAAKHVFALTEAELAALVREGEFVEMTRTCVRARSTEAMRWPPFTRQWRPYTRWARSANGRCGASTKLA
ncbi:MAG: type II toxin-antitoxin system RelE/ParE family toxin [Bryobacteraceae bacterium]|nr:type II toxin-antitoxin system RelE/ParE family toxin [Bryobacteraceae bacterium]